MGKRRINILVADRNPHVRELLKRELAQEGLQVITANSWREVLEYAFGPTMIDLLIVDPNLPDMDTERLLQKIGNRIPPLPIILHTLPGDESTAEHLKGSVFSVEKGNGCIEQLKKLIDQLLTVKNAPKATYKKQGAVHHQQEKL